MKETLDIQTEEIRYRSLLTKELLLFVGVSALYIISLVLGLFLSGEDYLIPMWILIALSVFYLWGTIFFWGVLYKRDKTYERFYSSALQGLRESDEVFFVSLSKPDEFTKEGLEAQLLKTSFTENGTAFERDFYVLGSFPTLEEGTKIKIESFSSVVLTYEVLHE